MHQGKLGIPEPKVLPGRTKPVPYVFVTDDAFALSNNIMKPYTGKKPGWSSPERIFNYRLSRARRIIENVFGVLSSKFRVLLKTIALHADKVESVVLSCIYLHNFLRRNATSKSLCTPPGSFDSEDSDGNLIPGSWRSDLEDTESLITLQNIPKRASIESQEIGNEFRDYFISAEGAVPWQYDLY